MSWLFEVTTTAPATYYWSTKAKTFDSQAYTFKVLPETFAGVTMNRAKSEFNIQAPNTLTFSITNKNNALLSSVFDNGSVLLKLVIGDGTNEEIIRQWLFSIKTVEPGAQQLQFTCEDFIQKYLKGDYPRTRLIRDLFPSADVDLADDVCIPVPFGTAYVPLRSVYIPGSISLTGTTISAVASTDGGNCKFQDAGNAFDSFEVGRYATVAGMAQGVNNGSFMVLAKSAGEIEVPADAGLVDEAAGATATVTQGSRYYVLGPSDKTYSISKVRSPGNGA